MAISTQQISIQPSRFLRLINSDRNSSTQRGRAATVLTADHADDADKKELAANTREWTRIEQQRKAKKIAASSADFHGYYRRVWRNAGRSCSSDSALHFFAGNLIRGLAQWAAAWYNNQDVNECGVRELQPARAAKPDKKLNPKGYPVI